MGGNFPIIRWFWTADQDQGFETGVPFDFVDGRLNRQWKLVNVTILCTLVTLLRQ